MDISIVSGTYNRLNSMQTMVNSVRRSFVDIFGLIYEIVLVDGGSTDGTMEWGKSQPDIRLIEHGKLLGAVKAFNDGAYAATGQYVILANDDIEFVDKSIFTAWLYMQSHKDCGIGCFYQDRNGKSWHIEEMPCVVDGKQASRPYGQVCIVPKWLGDYVGWWCKDEDFTSRGFRPLHTYGGDNEISAKIYELGFKVSPIPDAKIHDREVADELRKINNIDGAKDPRAVRGHHPDSWAWGRRWRDSSSGLVGPVIKPLPVMENQTVIKERFVYLPIYERGWAIQKQQKRGLREALSKVGLVAEFDYVSYDNSQQMIADLQKLIDRIRPTIVLTQIHNDSQIKAQDILSLKSMFPYAKFINWNGDYWPENLLSEGGISLARVFDLQLVINRDVLDKYQAMGINANYWQIGWEPDGIGHQPDKYYDVVFLASGYSQQRKQLVRKLRSLSLNFGLYGTGWPDNWAQGQCMYDFITACKIYRGAKISIGDSQWPETGFVSNRVFQALAAGGSALAYQYFRDMDQLGLVDGQTCIVWNDFRELDQKIQYYLNHEDERERIAEAGEKLALEQHSFDARVQELLFMLESERQMIEDWRW